MVFQPLVRKSIGDFRRLFFLLGDVRENTLFILPKTIIYFDSKGKLIVARYLLIKELVTKHGFTKERARKIVRRFDADVRAADQDILFDDFAREDGECRIMLATVSLGMGMDLPDVERVVQFGPPPSLGIPDVVQRFRRAMRGREIKQRCQGIAYFFVPYWWFDHLGYDEKEKEVEKAKAKVAKEAAKAAAKRAVLPRSRGLRFAPAVQSRLREMTLADRGSDDEGSVTSQAT